MKIRENKTTLLNIQEVLMVVSREI
jgi:hypothetical protein